MNQTDAIPGNEREVVRNLAIRLRDIAALPIQQTRIDLWKRHNALQGPTRPIIYLSPEGSWGEIIPPDATVCHHPLAYRLEYQLRMRLQQHEHFKDDIPVEAVVDLHLGIGDTGWGLEPKRVAATEKGGSWHHDPVLNSHEDLQHLRLPQVTLDEDARALAKAQAEDLVGDLLAVRLHKVTSCHFHLMKLYSDFRGLENTYLDMFDNPGMLHDCLAHFTAGYQGLLQQWINLDLLELNNNNTYHSSGGRGWTDALPAADFTGSVRPQDLWASAEVQELAVVGPEQHEEFALRYERDLLTPFGLTGYGCCEDLTNKMDLVTAIPNMRRISISPWADVDRCAERLEDRYVYSWKPLPTHLASDWNETRLRPYLRHTIDTAKRHHCFLEMILKDTHTCYQHPERFDRWAAIAREEIVAAGYDVETWPFDE